MSISDNGRPPVPGQGSGQVPPQPVPPAQGASQWQAQPTQQPSPSQPPVQPRMVPSAPGAAGAPKKGSRRLRMVLLGLGGGIVGALAVVFALMGLGIIGGTQVIETTNSSAGQTINITASGEDATVAQAAAAKALPSVVVVNVSSSSATGLGSGVIYDTDGNIITNNHVIDGATSVSVTYDGKSYDASVVGTDASSDLAVIHVDWGDTQVTPMEIADSDKLVVGDWVMTVGSPFGLDQSVSAGIVSSLARNQMMKSASGNTLYTNLIQTDAAINPGNSGGALVNSEGKLVGICTLFSSDTESFAGIGFAIPSNYAKDVADKIIAGETVTHAYIGLSMSTVTAQNAKANDLSVTSGAYVAKVTDGGPAAAAGIQVGDVITKVNGEDIQSADGMILNVRSHKIGETVTVTLMRGDEEKTVTVTLGSDENLQKEQSDSNSQQRQKRGSDGSSDDDVMREIYDYLNNNRGGSYESDGASVDNAA